MRQSNLGGTDTRAEVLAAAKRRARKKGPQVLDYSKEDAARNKSQGAKSNQGVVDWSKEDARLNRLRGTRRHR